MAKRVIALTIIGAVTGGLTVAMWVLDDATGLLTIFSVLMLIGAVTLLAASMAAPVASVAASWNPGLAAVLVVMLAVVATSSQYAGRPLGAVAALVAAIAIAVITWRTRRVNLAG